MRIRTLPQIAAFFLAAGVIVIAVHFTLEAGMRSIRTDMFGAFNRVADGNVNADLIVIGSSRATLHYDPAILQKATGLSAFNLGRIGARSEINAGILGWYLHHNRPPRLLIQNADPTSLTANRYVYDPPQYTPYLRDSALYHAMRNDTGIRKMRYLPLYGYVSNDIEGRHYLGVRALFGIQPYEYYSNGYLGLDREYNDANLDLDPNEKELVYRSDSEGIHDFGAALADARALGIPAIVVFSPMHRSMIERTAKFPELVAEIARAAQAQNALFWDLSALEPISGDKEYFSDGFHMNRRGATAFTEVVGRKIAEWVANQGCRITCQSKRLPGK